VSDHDATLTALRSLSPRQRACVVLRYYEDLPVAEVAATLGDPGAAREVGQALARNPFAVIVPCHRVVKAGGRTGGFSATGGVTTKLRLLEIERARLTSEPTLFDHDEAFARLQRHR